VRGRFCNLHSQLRTCTLELIGDIK
jgi:hypothetical protein